MEEESARTKESLQELRKAIDSTIKGTIKASRFEKRANEIRWRTQVTLREWLALRKRGLPVSKRNIEAMRKSTKELTAFQMKLDGMQMPSNLLMKGLIMLKDAVINVATGLIKTAYNFAKTTSSIKSLGDAVDAGLGDIKFLGPVAKKIAEELDANIQMYKGLAQSGATFNSSILEMRNAASQASMPLVQFQELIQNNSSTMARMFGSVNQGIPQIVALGEGLRKFTEDELAGFGITMDEANQFLGTYMELSRARGLSESMTSQQLLAGTKEYAKNLTTLSRLTGESVDELDKKNRADARDGILQTYLARMEEGDRERFQAMLRSLPADVKGPLMELALLESPISSAAQGLQLLSQGRFEAVLDEMMAGTGKLTEEQILQFNNQIKSLMTEVGGSEMAAAFGRAGLAGGEPIFRETLNMVTAMKGAVAKEDLFAAASLAAQEGTTKELINTQSTLERNTVSMQNLGTAILGKIVLDDKSMGKKVLEAFNDDAGKSVDELQRSLGETFGLYDKEKKAIRNQNFKLKASGSRGAGWINYDPNNKPEQPAPRGSPEWVEQMKKAYQRRAGSYGATGQLFENFGSGTPVTLHGEESVVPKDSMFGAALSLLAEIKKIGSGIPISTPQGGGGGGGSGDTRELLKAMTTNAENTAKAANFLNKLVAINMATERNTKNTNKELADMGGSLV